MFSILPIVDVVDSDDVHGADCTKCSTVRVAVRSGRNRWLSHAYQNIHGCTLSPHSTTPTPTPTSSRGSSRGCRRVCRSAWHMNNFRKSRVSGVSARILARMSVSVSASWNAGFMSHVHCCYGQVFSASSGLHVGTTAQVSSSILIFCRACGTYCALCVSTAYQPYNNVSRSETVWSRPSDSIWTRT